MPSLSRLSTVFLATTSIGKSHGARDKYKIVNDRVQVSYAVAANADPGPSLDRVQSCIENRHGGGALDPGSKNSDGRRGDSKHLVVALCSFSEPA